jgi:diaminopimelate decarboxylase
MSAPIHASLSRWPIEGDCLVVGGVRVTQLAHRVGNTPFYVYDRRLLNERVELLRRHLPDRIKPHYAIKANPMPALVAHMAARVDGLDVASAGELKIALAAGANPLDVSFAGPGKRDEELRDAVAAGILVNVESAREIGILERLSRELGTPARVAVRVNPDFELKSSGMKMGGGPKQFGVDAENVPQILRDIGRAGLAFEGFHIYSGSQNLRPDAICEAQQKSVELAIKLAPSAPSPVRVLTIGGGFGIPYSPGARPLDLAPIEANLRRVVSELSTALPEAQVVLELGRYLVGEAGLYVCRVIDRKISRGQVFLVTDGGLHHHLSASGNFGQVISKNYPVTVANRMREGKREIASLVGPLHAARSS